MTRWNEWDDEPDVVDLLQERFKLESRCRVCGSTEVRWRQQGGQWVLFSLQPGVPHECDADDLAKDFE